MSFNYIFFFDIEDQESLEYGDTNSSQEQFFFFFFKYRVLIKKLDLEKKKFESKMQFECDCI